MKQAEMVLAADPGVPGHAPRVWVYRNNIKALNWFSSVREKLGTPETGCFLLLGRSLCAFVAPQTTRSIRAGSSSFETSPTPPTLAAQSPSLGTAHIT